MVHLINMHHETCHSNAVRIDRRTRWGNPFIIGRDGSRAEVIEMYRKHIFRQVRTGLLSLEDLASLHGQDLACWCHPDPCHGEVLISAAAWAHQKLQSERGDQQ